MWFGCLQQSFKFLPKFLHPCPCFWVSELFAVFVYPALDVVQYVIEPLWFQLLDLVPNSHLSGVLSRFFSYFLGCFEACWHN